MKIVYYRMINVMSNRKYLPMEACRKNKFVTIKKRRTISMAIDRNQEPDIDIDEVTKHDPKDRENLLAK